MDDVDLNAEDLVNTFYKSVPDSVKYYLIDGFRM